eukprot:scaffold4150_cov138-Isochrysis_galbana.AAC.3
MRRLRGRQLRVPLTRDLTCRLSILKYVSGVFSALSDASSSLNVAPSWLIFAVRWQASKLARGHTCAQSLPPAEAHTSSQSAAAAVLLAPPRLPCQRLGAADYRGELETSADHGIAGSKTKGPEMYIYTHILPSVYFHSTYSSSSYKLSSNFVQQGAIGEGKGTGLRRGGTREGTSGAHWHLPHGVRCRHAASWHVPVPSCGRWFASPMMYRRDAHARKRG